MVPTTAIDSALSVERDIAATREQVAECPGGDGAVEEQQAAQNGIVLAEGRIVESGDKSLALKLEEQGYSWVAERKLAGAA